MKKEQLSYFLENFKLAFSTNINLKEIKIGYDESCSVQITNSEVENPITNLNSIAIHKWKGEEIPFIFNTTQNQEVLKKVSQNKVIINYDIISAGWYLMSGAQELDNSNNDQYGRFQFANSIQNKLNIAHIPVVNYYFDILKEAIEMVTNKKLIPNRKFSATITHDIDEVSSGWKHRIRTNLGKKNPLKAIQFGISHWIKPFHPWKNLIELSDFNKSQGVDSTFFFLCRNNKLNEIKNADYTIQDSYIQKSIQHLDKNGQEIGIHGSYKTHDSSEELKNDVEKIESKIFGNRFHFLHYSIKETSKIIDDLNLQYDTTLGFQETIGFRNSICTPFKLYNFETNEPHYFIEIPLNIMDCSLEFENYMGLSITESRIAVKSLIQEIKKFNGNVCVNWHNTYFSDYLKADWKIFYKEIIQLLKEENCEFITCNQLVVNTQSQF